MKVQFLQASVPLTKHFRLVDGNRDVTPYPQVSRFTSIDYEIDTLAQFHQAIVDQAEQGVALYKGLLDRPLVNESRRDRTLTNEPTAWICLDFDGMTAYDTIEEALRDLGLGGVSYVRQYSASHNIKPGLNAHVFMLLERPVAPSMLKLWLKHLNLSVVANKMPLTLTASHCALRWPLDITTCQADKILYIAPPIFEGMDDPCTEPRIDIVIHRNERLDVQFPLDLASIDDRIRTRVNQLREDLGLRARIKDPDYVAKFDAVVQLNPQAARVSDRREARGFVYLNIDNGDSWGYYHPETNADVIYNFKGEDNYPTAKFLPDYYPEARRLAAQRAAERAAEHAEAEARREREAMERAHNPANHDGNTRYFVFNDAPTARYFNAIYEPSTDTLTLNPGSDLKRMQDFCAEHDVVFPDPIPNWTVVFDPTNPKTIDPDRRTLNLYHPTEYKRYCLQITSGITPLVGSVLPYEQLLRHVMGGCDITVERFVNWLAYIWQTGKKPKTAWVFHGVPGTGKGLLQGVLRALFGEHLYTTTPGFLQENFNGSLETLQILWIDEADIESFDSKRVEPKLKTWITEDVINIRRMRTEAVNVRNYMGLIFASNRRHAAMIDLGDRRYNVAPRQETPLAPTREFVASLMIPDNLRAFAVMLQNYAIDEYRVRTPLDNEARQAMQQVTVSSVDALVNALNEGDFEHLVYLLDAHPHGRVTQEFLAYKHTLAFIYDKLKGTHYGKRLRIGLKADEIRSVFEFALGWNYSPRKFTTILQLHGIDMSRKQIRRGEARHGGLYLSFSLTEVAEQMMKQLISEQETPARPTHLHAVK